MDKTTALYTEWLEKAVSDPDLKAELETIDGKAEEISDRFYRDLEFGTGGLRGVIGAGTNRMNVYTVGKATQGLANYLKNTGKENLSVAVAYDSRIKSDVFARHAASIFAANGIKAHIYPELMPTPMLSFAVRALGCDAGIIVTASHNPAKYNGYKVYGSDGCQVTLTAAEQILGEIEKLDIFADVKASDFDAAVSSGEISYIPQSVIDDYIANVKKQSIHPELCAASGLKVVYTPLNGAGNKPVRRILSEIGITDVTVVKEQEMPDGNFTTCPYPNPEIREALELGLKLCEEVKPDLLLATDPDSDRVGIAVPDGDGYVLFTGNEVGAMLLEYIARERIANGTMPKNPIAVKTIVTTELVRAIAAKYGVQLIDVLTGFKFIGEQIGFLEEKGEEDRYIFGFEESYGYLAGSYVRDKDAVVGSMLICEMAAFYRSKGISLVQARADMYKDYGYYCNKLENFAFEGESGMKKMNEIMDKLRTDYPQTVAGKKVIGLADYKLSVKNDLVNGTQEILTLPKSNVITLYLEDNASIVVRPSGTEPKIKLYYTTVGADNAEAAAIQEALSADFTKYALN
ncbi:MAG: phospho-sugar mutase [Eubacterium sp.]|nr:phospho-sugar mutase [Eubacterium sp.]